MSSSSKKTYIIYSVVFIVIVILLLLPIQIPYSITVNGKILPSREWVVSKSDGILITMLSDNKTGLNRNYAVSEFIRGDAIQFVVNENLASGEPVSVNDTIGTIYSNEISRMISELNGEIETARRTLDMYTSGEKEGIVEEVESRLAYMKKQAEENRKLFERKKAQFEKNVISEEEYELYKGTAELSDINVIMTEAQLKTVQTGMRQQEIDYAKAQINSLQNQLEILNQRNKNFTLLSQVTGIARRIASGDTLLIISDTTEYITYMSIPWEDRDLLYRGQDISVSFPTASVSPEGRVLRMEHAVYNINGKQVTMATGLITTNTEELVPGLMVECNIECDPITPLQYIKRVFF